MPGWVWVLIAIAVVVVLGVVVWQALARRRTERLRDRFGPEYDRTIGTAENRREAESDLAAREERRDRLEIRPLSQAARDRYVQSWQAVQAQFVDDPSVAVASADSLIESVMAERGYPVEDFEQRAADVSVDHPQVVENYRDGHRLAEESANGDGSTESLRQAMRHYRALFEELVEADADQPLQREQSEDVPVARDSAERQVR
jgi:cytoskeletal protein RodZ